ncbi:YrhA family protein, partial [Escherichia coli]|nr:YrhA family protein [Escherichia coli]MCV5280492.1 YrhA family protein [Escherichia coli]
ADRNRSHWSTSKTPSYTKSVSWQHHRNNDDFINPDLQERLVIGDDSISIFTYDIKSNFFEIRDNIGTENIFSSFSDFSSFLNEIMDSCS